jgi:amidase
VRAARWEGRGALRTLIELAWIYPYGIEWNLTGQPALAIPGDTDDDGLPIGVQLVGRHNAEATLLALGAQLEAELGWPARRPSVS